MSLLPDIYSRRKTDSTTPTPAPAPTGSWTDAFPAPRITAPVFTREEALSDLSSPDLLIVDVRRTDYEGGTIRGSINLPAHSFYMNRSVLYDLCKRAGVKRVAFYCGMYSFFFFFFSFF
jgi:arsenical-resistance protein 2